MTNEINNEEELWQNWSLHQGIAVAISIRISSFISMSASGYIIYQVFHSDKREAMLKTLYHRIILTISALDIISSLALFMGTWPIPKDIVHDDWIWGNIGTQTTCSIQGYFIQGSLLSVALSTTFLCIYFMLLIRYNWSERRLKKVEYMMRFGICLMFAMCLIPLFNDAYNPTPAVCCVESYPIGCDKSDEYGCIRGENAKHFRFTLFTIPVVIFMITIVVTMSLLYASVKKQEQAAAGYRSSRSTQSYSRTSRRVFVKVVWFIGSFCFIWIPTLFIIQKPTGGCYFWLYLTSSIVIPLQGLFNAIIYNYEKLKNSDIVRRTSFLRLAGRGSSAVNMAREVAMVKCDIDCSPENDEES